MTEETSKPGAEDDPMAKRDMGTALPYPDDMDRTVPNSHEQERKVTTVEQVDRYDVVEVPYLEDQFYVDSKTRELYFAIRVKDEWMANGQRPQIKLKPGTEVTIIGRAPSK